MFPTFSGNSRRPRQVNLSGQNTNPFSATPWISPPAGTTKTVAQAQLERQERQQGRERLHAAKRILKTWRGHRARRILADARRAEWDRLEQPDLDPQDKTLAQQLQLLVAFFSPRREDDFPRLLYLSRKAKDEGFQSFLEDQHVQPQLPGFADVVLEALQVTLPSCPIILFELVIAIIEQQPNIIPRIVQRYYILLSQLVSRSHKGDIGQPLMLHAIKAPLASSVRPSQDYDVALNAYAALGVHFLITPEITTSFGHLEDLARFVDIDLLSVAILQPFFMVAARQLSRHNRLWLLAHFIALHRLQKQNSQEPDYIRALSLQLSLSSSDIVDYLEPLGSDDLQERAESDESMANVTPAPHDFIKEELLSLVNQASITGLLDKFNAGYAKSSVAGREEASLLASYALTILRMFPRRGDEIRMWLYLGSLTTSAGIHIPALRFFWQAMSSTNTYTAIKADSMAALAILKPQTSQQNKPLSSTSTYGDREWRTILLFLELYTFILRFTDDEDFLSGGSTSSVLADESVSRIRQSALPVEDVRALTLFLKNLAFTMYYNSSELSEHDRFRSESGLGTYFGGLASPSRFQTAPREAIPVFSSREFAGIAGMNFTYVRGIVSGVMRMLYERDSRRRFLPRGHWLMTSRFDMEGFIPAVVQEEERQNDADEEGEEEDNEDVADSGSRSNLGLIGMATARRALQVESLKQRQQKAARRKMLAAIEPRLEVLQNMPFVIPFETRVQIFHQFVHQDQVRRRNGDVDPDDWRFSMMSRDVNHRSGREIVSRHHARIKRGSVFEDAYEQFWDLGEGLKEPIQITFVDRFDAAEAGIDGGGVTKEFLTSVTNEAFRATDGLNLFVANDQNLLYPNPTAYEAKGELLRQAGIKESSFEWNEYMNDFLRHYEFLGRIVGKCLYEGILIDIGFAGFFLLKWAASGASGSESGYRANINDLRDFDESFYQNLLKIKNLDNVEELGVDFTIIDRVFVPGQPPLDLTQNLLPNGANIPVTNENRPLYISLVARHRLQRQGHRQTKAFLNGLGQIIKPSWLSMFNQSELQTLIGGDSSEIDVEDLRRNTLYGGLYVIGYDGLEHPTVQMFWKVVKEMDDGDRRKLLKYVTSTPRAPLLGFSQLNPRFSIRDGGTDEARLPSTSTCVNLLKLPRYSTRKVLQEKLLYAINSGAGFDLS